MENDLAAFTPSAGRPSSLAGRQGNNKCRRPARPFPGIPVFYERGTTDGISSPYLRGELLRNKQIRVPVTGDLLNAPYAFRNGVLNLVRPLPMTVRIMTEAKRLAVDGNLLNKHEAEMLEPAKLLAAIATPESAERKKERRIVEQLFADYGLKFYREEQLEELADDVKTYPH